MSPADDGTLGSTLSTRILVVGGAPFVDIARDRVGAAAPCAQRPEAALASEAVEAPPVQGASVRRPRLPRHGAAGTAADLAFTAKEG